RRRRWAISFGCSELAQAPVPVVTGLFGVAAAVLLLKPPAAATITSVVKPTSTVRGSTPMVRSAACLVPAGLPVGSGASAAKAVDAKSEIAATAETTDLAFMAVPKNLLALAYIKICAAQKRIVTPHKSYFA